VYAIPMSARTANAFANHRASLCREGEEKARRCGIALTDPKAALGDQEESMPQPP